MPQALSLRASTATRVASVRGCLLLLLWCKAIIAYGSAQGTNRRLNESQWHAAMAQLLPSLNFAVALVKTDIGAESARLLTRNAARGRAKQMRQVMDCWNNQVKSSSPTTWDTAMSTSLHLENIRISTAWWWEGGAKKPIYSKSSSRKPALTIASIASLERLDQLQAQCKSWSGPMSIVVYQGLLASQGTNTLTEEHQAILQSAVLQITELLVQINSIPGSCKPDILLVWELFASQRAMQLLYPINILRSLARLQARTPLVADIDVDLVISSSWNYRFNNRGATLSAITQAMNKTVFIVPSFEVSMKVERRPAWADALASAAKDIIVAAQDMEYVRQFKKKHFAAGHRMVDHEHWINATQDYAVQYEYESEPYIIGSRMLLPWHDARYRGYGKNKVQYVADVHAHGFTFKVMHDVYMLHRPHKKTDAWKAYIADKKSNNTAGEGLYARVLALFEDEMRALNSSQPYTAVLHPATQHCIEVLPWWSSNLKPFSRETWPSA